MQGASFVNPSNGLTVKQLIEVLKEFPQESLIAFQVGDEVDSTILSLSGIEYDSLWEITDFLFEEWVEDGQTEAPASQG